MNRTGATAEALAVAFLRQQGLDILAQNWRCRFGEIDIIARDGSCVVFVEVRKRSNLRYGGAASSITSAKMKKLVATAEHYLSTLPRTPACRFDAILFEGDQAIEWIKNAFQAGG
ncbi:YraN family protein [Parachitinimonas caeni]|uniref:UPF0102 protein PZA18_04470 n=1 Tax=Parachitinimonas caeni TaxID=3031301 RepID=A0ABT7DT99_9NEIS|nr:YraN family protein [Parachitinimonas caeni]MDK2123304.1 YraN family protein [Parachitinimonas caeni]